MWVELGSNTYVAIPSVATADGKDRIPREIFSAIITSRYRLVIFSRQGDIKGWLTHSALPDFKMPKVRFQIKYRPNLSYIAKGKLTTNSWFDIGPLPPPHCQKDHPHLFLAAVVSSGYQENVGFPLLLLHPHGAIPVLLVLMPLWYSADAHTPAEEYSLAGNIKRTRRRKVRPQTGKNSNGN